MYPCQKCLENNWKFQNERELLPNNMQNVWTVATCKICGNQVEFGHKTKPHHFGTEKAEYKIKQLKNKRVRYLKIDGKFVRVELGQNKNGDLKVMPLKELKNSKEWTLFG